jgi:hypothetical protein
MTVRKSRILLSVGAALLVILNTAAKLPVVTKQATFDHTRNQHKATCDTCHLREGNETVTTFPGHQACIGCHIADFTVTQSDLCWTCHKLPLNSNADTRPFPQLSQFGLRSFSHRDHLNPAKLSKESKVPTCEFCHKFDSSENKAGFPSHPQCYACHAHEPEAKKGACDTCHAAPDVSLKYATETGRATTEYRFYHGNHFKVASIQRVCSKCHTTNPAAAPNEVDVLQFEPIPDKIAHNSSCWQSGCHVSKNEQRCSKCHVKPPVQIQISSD